MLCLGIAGIKKLEMYAPGTDGRRAYESTGVYSPDGEFLPFNSSVVTEGRPEDWLNRVEDAMFSATKKLLYKVCFLCISSNSLARFLPYSWLQRLFARLL